MVHCVIATSFRKLVKVDEPAIQNTHNNSRRLVAVLSMLINDDTR